MCRRAAHRERPASFVSWKPMRERTADGSFGRQKIPAFRAGRRARTARTKQGRGPLLWFCDLGARRAPRSQNTAAPPSASHASLLPPASALPPAPRRLLMGSRKEGADTGGGGVWRPGGGPRAAPRPAKQKSGVRGQGPRAPRFSGRFASRRRPPPLGFPLTPKRQHKSQAFHLTRPRPVHRPEKGGSDREPLRGRLQPSRRAERGFFRRGAATE